MNVTDGIIWCWKQNHQGKWSQSCGWEFIDALYYQVICNYDIDMTIEYKKGLYKQSLPHGMILTAFTVSVNRNGKEGNYIFMFLDEIQLDMFQNVCSFYWTWESFQWEWPAGSADMDGP